MLLGYINNQLNCMACIGMHGISGSEQASQFLKIWLKAMGNQHKQIAENILFRTNSYNPQ